MASPNLIERVENLNAALDECEAAIEEPGNYPEMHALSMIEDARGIAGEILTMIDGR